MDTSYPKKEVDLMLQLVDKKIEAYHKEVMVELKQHQVVHTELLKQVKFTNGKVKKLTFAMIAVAAFALGMGIQNLNELIQFFI